MMRNPVTGLACVLALALAGCEETTEAEVKRTVADVNVIDESNLNDLMLTIADPTEAVAHFRRTSEAHPERIDLKRGLAKSLVRAQRPDDSLAIWQQVLASDEATDEDRLAYAGALIRTGDWQGARAELDRIPPTVETFDRYRLEAMVADARKDWRRADSFYATAADLTTRPAGVLNNWGYSKLVREDFAGAERLFAEALQHDPGMFTTKNNLAIARAGQRNYALPVIDLTQSERAQLLYTLALGAIKQGDVSIGRGLLREAIDTHPQHFEEAARSLAALEGRDA